MYLLKGCNRVMLGLRGFHGMARLPEKACVQSCSEHKLKSSLRGHFDCM